MSARAEALFGYDQKEAAGESFLMLLAPGQPGGGDRRASARRARGRGRARRRRARGRRARSRRAPIPVRLDFRPARPRRPSPSISRFYSDLSKPARPSASATAAREEAEKASARKTDFLAARQPRDPHAAARHSRLRRGDDGRAVRADRQRALQGLRQGHPRLGPACDEPGQRPARSRQDRGGQDGARNSRRSTPTGSSANASR